MARRDWQLTGAIVTVTLLAAGSAGAQSPAVSGEQIEKLELQIKSLERELQAMKKKLDASDKSYAAAAAKTPSASTKPAGSSASALDKQAIPATAPAVAKMSSMNRPGICTADGANCVAFTSRVQMDVGGYNYHPNTAFTAPQHLDSGFNVRRAQIGVVGSFLTDWNYALVYDFGGSSDGLGGLASGSLPGAYPSGIVNAYVSYAGIKNLTITGGYIDTPYSIEGATSSVDVLFLERASAQSVAANIAAGIIRSAFGAKWNNDWFWAGAYLTGPNSGAVHIGSSTPTVTGLTQQYGGFARVAAQIVNEKDLTVHIGGDAEFLFKAPLNATTGIRSLTLSDRPELRVDPTSILTTGAIANVDGVHVYSAEAAATYGPLFVQGEYFFYGVDRLVGLPTLNFKGGYVDATWTLTGEAHPYNAANANYANIIPNDPFTWAGGGVGAWEIAARYSVVDLNDRLGFSNGVAGGKQTVYTAGINWYANRNVKFMLDYYHGTIEKQKSALDTTNVGAKFDAVAMRTQVAF